MVHRTVARLIVPFLLGGAATGLALLGGAVRAEWWGSWPQEKWLLAGVISAFVVLMVSWRLVRRGALPLFFLSVGAVLVGTRLLGWEWQRPSSLLLLLFVPALAEVQVRSAPRPGLGTFGLAFFGASFVALLVCLNMRFATPIALSLLAAGVAFHAHQHKHLRSRIFGLSLGALLASPLLWFGLHSYQQQRLLAWWDSSADPQGSGYWYAEAQRILTDAGWFGSQTPWSEASTIANSPLDSPFLVLAHQHGHIGVLGTVALTSVIAGAALWLMRQSRRPFSRAVAGGISVFWLAPTLLASGAAYQVFPMLGLPVPLLAGGGSMTIAAVASIGMLIRIRWQNEDDEQAELSAPT